MTASNITIKETRLYLSDLKLRVPFMFGGTEVTHMPLAHVAVTVETRYGKRATGWAADTLNVWFDRTAKSWPEKKRDLVRVIVEAGAIYRTVLGLVPWPHF